MMTTSTLEKPSVYVETTVISYLAARPSTNVIVLAHQHISQLWWAQKDRFDVYASGIVLREAQNGDPVLAQKRVALLEETKLLPSHDRSDELALALIKAAAIPAKAATDATHIATAALYGMTYLLSWNFTHIANASTRNKIEAVLRDAGLVPTIICSPEELLDIQPDLESAL